MARVTSFTISKSSVSSVYRYVLIPHKTEFRPNKDFYGCYMCKNWSFSIKGSRNGIIDSNLICVGDTAFVIAHNTCKRAFEIQLVAPEID